MKKANFKMLLISGLMFFFTIAMNAQQPGAPPPPPQTPSGGSNLPVGGGAPIGSGLLVLVVLSIGYGFKLYHKSIDKPMI